MSLKRGCGIVIFNPSCTDVLMIRRSGMPHKDKIALIGGKQEPGEYDITCACRELHEESGLQYAHFSCFKYMMSISYLNGWVVNYYYGVLKEDIDYDRDITFSNEEGTLEWHSIANVSDALNDDLAFEGVSAYAISNALYHLKGEGIL